MARKTIHIEKVEQGMKIAAAVVTVSGQRLLAAGVLLDNDNIAQLKKAGIRYVQIYEAAYQESINADVFQDIIKGMNAREAAGAEAPPAPVPAVEPSPPAAPLPAPPAEATEEDREKKVEDVKKTTASLRAKYAEEKKEYSQKYGEKYTTISYTLGEPAPRQSTAPDAPFVDLLNVLARNMTDKLIFERKIDEDTIQLMVRDVVSELSNRQNVMRLLTTAYSVSRYLLSHMVNVSLFSMRLAAEMKLSSTEVVDVAIGAILHDIGMVLIPVGFWTTRRELNPQTRSEVQKHTELGYRLIRETPNTREAWAVPALEHHERLDGGGYPAGKQGGQLTVASRIVQICDVYEAMTSDRSYRYAKFPDVSMKHILGSPEQFDRDIAQIFCKSLGFYPEGYTVKLSSGEQAVVLSSNPKNVFRPLIRLLTNSAGSTLTPEAQLVLDLSHRLDLRIIEISNRRLPAAS